MSTIPAKTIERNRDNPDGRDHVCAPPSNHTYHGEEVYCFAFGRRHMKVKLCARCPYTPRDLAGHYDPEAALHVCAKCDGEHGMLTNHYPRGAHRRRKCSTVHNLFGTT